MTCQPFPSPRRELARQEYYGRLIERSSVMLLNGKYEEAARVRNEAYALAALWVEEAAAELRAQAEQETEPCGDGQS